jgi:hypothetical protein
MAACFDDVQRADAANTVAGFPGGFGLLGE